MSIRENDIVLVGSGPKAGSIGRVCSIDGIGARVRVYLGESSTGGGNRESTTIFVPLGDLTPAEGDAPDCP